VALKRGEEEVLEEAFEQGGAFVEAML